jgi:hypothetical protein
MLIAGPPQYVVITQPRHGHIGIASARLLTNCTHKKVASVCVEAWLPMLPRAQSRPSSVTATLPDSEQHILYCILAVFALQRQPSYAFQRNQ